VIEFHDVYKTKWAVKHLYALLREREPEANISHKETPSYADHTHFVSTLPYWRWWLLSDGENWLGALSVSHRNEVGIAIFKEFRGQGWARDALIKLVTEIKPQREIPGERLGTFVANINPENEKSIRLFERAGFKLVQNTYILEGGP
jgi:RimJ/RimL family protein N-acetyltransferase